MREVTSTNTVSEVISILQQRTTLLDAVHATPKDKRTLVADLNCSRSTVDRAVRELEALGLLTYGDGGYESTVCGQLAAEEYRQFEQRIEILLELQPFLQWMSLTEFDLQLEWLADADLLLPKPNDPYAMIHRHVTLLQGATHIECMLPLTGLQASEAVYESVVEKGARCETVVEPGVAETFQQPEYAELIEELMATGRSPIFVCDKPIPYFVGVFDEEVVQIGVDEDGEPRAILETESEEVCAWAQQKIEEYKQQSTKLRSSQLASKTDA